MTPERLAEIERILYGRDQFALFGDVAEELLAALREAQEQIVGFQQVLEDRDKYADALQSRVETLEKELLVYGQHLNTCQDCRGKGCTCGFREAALRGETPPSSAAPHTFPGTPAGSGWPPPDLP